MDDKTFYMIYVEGMNSPIKIHTTYAEAEKEAIRLAKSENKKVYILQAIKSVEVANIKITNLCY